MVQPMRDQLEAQLHVAVIGPVKGVPTVSRRLGTPQDRPLAPSACK
jgi:hypothetical protein